MVDEDSKMKSAVELIFVNTLPNSCLFKYEKKHITKSSFSEAIVASYQAINDRRIELENAEIGYYPTLFLCIGGERPDVELRTKEVIDELVKPTFIDNGDVAEVVFPVFVSIGCSKKPASVKDTLKIEDTILLKIHDLYQVKMLRMRCFLAWMVCGYRMCMSRKEIIEEFRINMQNLKDSYQVFFDNCHHNEVQ